MPECSAKPGRGSKCDKNRSLSKLRAISEMVLPPTSGAKARAACGAHGRLGKEGRCAAGGRPATSAWGAAPNIIRLAHQASLLVHEAVNLATYEQLGLPPALLAHLQAVHTDVSLLGQIAAAAEAKNLVASHLGPRRPGHSLRRRVAESTAR
jgi:hypothetical protein